MSTMVKYTGKGGQLEGAIAEPAGTGKVGAVVVLQEWHGVTDQMKGKVDRVAGAGYLGLCPDLYHGKIASDDTVAAELMGKLVWDDAIAEIGDALAHLRAHPRSNGKVGLLGFCMGGALTLAGSLRLEGIACAVPFYGLPHIPVEKYARLKVPVLGHYAKTDEWAKASVAEEIEKTVRSGGGHMAVFVYDAGHAFMRETDPTKYDATSAKLAWERTTEFLKKHLS
jgi:carboxymethylenebutenolidase